MAVQYRIHPRRGILAAFALAMFLAAGPAVAQTVRIVAIGDSNTYGYGVQRPGAYPAQLEGLLHAKGYDVTIANAGKNGDMTAEGMARLANAIPKARTRPSSSSVATTGGRAFPRSRSRGTSTSSSHALRSQGIEVLLVGFDPNDFSAVAEKYGALYYPDFFAGVTTLGRKRGDT